VKKAMIVSGYLDESGNLTKEGMDFCGNLTVDEIMADLDN